jgi:predicted metal-dependent enzyme (double-stranded beta helix superfamily)
MVIVDNSYKDDRNKRMMLTGTRSTLSQARLREIVREVAAQRPGWRSLVRYDPAQRWYQLLQQHDDHEIWLLSWLPGQSTGFHDHGWSAGAFTVAEGCLAERGARRGRPRRRSVAVTAGAARSFGPWYIHDVRNSSGAPAVSVHAYSPPLTGMQRFDLVAGQLVAGAAETGAQW